MAQKVRQSLECRKIKLPQSTEAKISQFADDTTLICSDINVLKESINVINNFSVISGLKLNKKKKKAMWIGSAKNNETKPLGFESYKEPIKSLGIYKMDNKLHIWQTRDLTLFGCTMLVKTLGLSKLVYAASMLHVPEMVIKRVQEKITNKKICYISISVKRWT